MPVAVPDTDGTPVYIPPPLPPAPAPPTLPPKVVTPVNIAASFTIGGGDLAGASRHFDGGASYSDEAAITSWSWSFGDGSGGAGQGVDHAYGAAGQYVVALVVHDAAGNAAQAARVVTVNAAAPPPPPPPPPEPPSP